MVFNKIKLKPFLAQKNELVITPSHFFKYATQPLWIWYDQFGDQSKKKEISEFTLKLMESGVLHEDEYIAGLEVAKIEAVKTEEAVDATVELMRQGCLGSDLLGVRPAWGQTCNCFPEDLSSRKHKKRCQTLEKREMTLFNSGFNSLSAFYQGFSLI